MKLDSENQATFGISRVPQSIYQPHEPRFSKGNKKKRKKRNMKEKENSSGICYIDDGVQTGWLTISWHLWCIESI